MTFWRFSGLVQSVWVTFVWVSDVFAFLWASPVCVGDVCMGK